MQKNSPTPFQILRLFAVIGGVFIAGGGCRREQGRALKMAVGHWPPCNPYLDAVLTGKMMETSVVFGDLVVIIRI